MKQLKFREMRARLNLQLGHAPSKLSDLGYVNLLKLINMKVV